MNWIERKIDAWVKKHWGDEYILRSDIENEVQKEILVAREEEKRKAKIEKIEALEHQQKVLHQLHSIRSASLLSEINSQQQELKEWENKSREIELEAVSNKENLQAILNFVFELQQTTKTLPEDTIKLTGRIDDLTITGQKLMEKLDKVPVGLIK